MSGDAWELLDKERQDRIKVEADLHFQIGYLKGEVEFKDKEIAQLTARLRREECRRSKRILTRAAPPKVRPA